MQYEVTLQSSSELLSGRYYSHEVPTASAQEKHEDYEKRTWRNRLHTNKNGEVILPGEAFKRSLDAAASRRGDKLKGNATYSKRFLSGVVVFDDVLLTSPGTKKPIKAESVESKAIHVPSDGMRGGAKRVMKFFPVVPEWTTKVVFDVVDDIITKPIFEQTLEYAGKFIGVGSMRAGNGGSAGRFEIISIKEIK